jgi:hypothetical protein
MPNGDSINDFKYITPCQSQCSRQSIKDIAQNEYERVSMIAKNCLHDNQISITDGRAKKAFVELQTIMCD